ncbi:MAG: hypothetical protein HY708_00165 [Ignavibacteriae bacterium]|nr:hypothetical protein [Ignavibacteriota bacterium]
MRGLPLLFIIVCFNPPALLAQAVPDTTKPLVEDTSAVAHPISTTPLSSSIDTVTKEYHPSKLPGVALLFSALVPGAGQVYNESYWKVPIVLGFGIYFASQWLDNHRRYKDYRDQFKTSITPENPSGNSQLFSIREFYKDQRDTFTWYFAILYFANLVDAYVDASLYDFEVGEDLSIRMLPGRGPRLTLQIGF